MYSITFVLILNIGTIEHGDSLAEG